jgi:hypothetical protein
MEAMIVNAVAPFSFECFLLIFLTSSLNLKNRLSPFRSNPAADFDERRSDADIAAS